MRRTAALVLGACGVLGCADDERTTALDEACSPLAQVAATYDFVRLVRREDGSVWKAAVEPDFVRVLGQDGPLLASDIAASGSSAYSDAIGCAVVDGEVWCFPLAGPLGFASDLGAGPDADAESLVPRPVVTGPAADAPTLNGVVQLSGGMNGGGASFCAVRAEGDLWCWGYSTNGLLGPGHPEHQSYAAPIRPSVTEPQPRVLEARVGYGTSCARLEDGSVTCWGDNTYGALGVLPASADTAEQLPTQVPLPAPARRLTASPGNTQCAILVDGSVECWGHNNYAQAGAPDTEAMVAPTRVLTAEAGPPLTGVLDLAPDAGMQAMCANTASTGLWCWGNAYRAGPERTPTGPYAAPVYEPGSELSRVQAPLTSWGATNGSLVFIDGSGKIVFGAGAMPTALQPRCD